MRGGAELRAQLAADTTVVPPVSYRGAQMVTAFLDAGGQVSVERVAERFGMCKRRLAETSGMTAEGVDREARGGGVCRRGIPRIRRDACPAGGA